MMAALRNTRAIVFDVRNYPIGVFYRDGHPPSGSELSSTCW
jgi:hypothetical protein